MMLCECVSDMTVTPEEKKEVEENDFVFDGETHAGSNYPAPPPPNPHTYR